MKRSRETNEPGSNKKQKEIPSINVYSVAITRQNSSYLKQVTLDIAVQCVVGNALNYCFKQKSKPDEYKLCIITHIKNIVDTNNFEFFNCVDLLQDLSDDIKSVELKATNMAEQILQNDLSQDLLDDLTYDLYPRDTHLTRINMDENNPWIIIYAYDKQEYLGHIYAREGTSAGVRQLQFIGIRKSIMSLINPTKASRRLAYSLFNGVIESADALKLAKMGLLEPPIPKSPIYEAMTELQVGNDEYNGEDNTNPLQIMSTTTAKQNISQQTTTVNVNLYTKLNQNKQIDQSTAVDVNYTIQLTTDLEEKKLMYTVVSVDNDYNVYTVKNKNTTFILFNNRTRLIKQDNVHTKKITDFKSYDYDDEDRDDLENFDSITSRSTIVVTENAENIEYKITNIINDNDNTIVIDDKRLLESNKQYLVRYSAGYYLIPYFKTHNILTLQVFSG